jgi:mevalonate kinase
VRERLARPDGPGLLERFRTIAREGMQAIAQGDREAAGRAMTENHLLLREVGVSHPRLEEMVRSVDGRSLGAKLTGAGAGGSILVLPIVGQETACLRRLARVGALAFAVRAAPQGASLLDPGSVAPGTP